MDPSANEIPLTYQSHYSMTNHDGAYQMNIG